MKLIIAEKPVLGRAIAAAIPGTASSRSGYTVVGDYTIVSAFGHLLTLKEPEDYDPERYRRWTLEALPIMFPDWGKKPGDGKEERLNLIGSLLKEAECVIHAGDPDDEGQYLIDEIINWFDYKGPVYRLATGDTTEGALRKALSSMTDNALHVNAGWSAHARSVADIMVGYNFSRYFTLKNPQVKMLTVGRVQTPTLGLVVARDNQIENHLKQYYYTVAADLLVEGKRVSARYEPDKNDPQLEDGKITVRDYAGEIAAGLRGAELDPVKVTEKIVQEQPPLPFNLVKLQTYCSNKFGYEPSQTLAITQALRDDHNAITYNRSDCQYLSEEQYKESGATMRQVMANLSGDPAGAVFGKMPLDMTLHSKCFDDKNITAHTAIIPQNKKVDLNRLTPEQRNVYLAIVKYYAAQFLPPAEKRRTALEAPLARGGSLKANSTEVVKPGYLQLIRPEKKKDDSEDEEQNELSQLKPGTMTGTCTDTRVEEKETKAPPRYTKASLNEDMTRIARYVTDPEAKRLLLAKDKDKKGENGSIGTSATRSTIIDNLEERGFIRTKGKQIESTPLGRELCRILPDELKKPDMTGYWWAVQESIQEGTEPWTALTDSVYEMICKVVKTEYPMVDALLVPENMRRGKPIIGRCPRCGSGVAEGERNFGCTGYRSGCRFLIPKQAEAGLMCKTVIKADMVKKLLEGGWEEELYKNSSGKEVPTGRLRTKATVKLKTLFSPAGEKTYAGEVCLTDDGPGSRYSASFSLVAADNTREVLGKCPRCGSGEIVEGKLGYGCTRYRDGCKFVIWKKQKQKILAAVSFTKTDAKKFLAGKTVRKTKLTAKDGTLFAGELTMEERPDNPFGPVFRIVEQAPPEAEASE